MGWLWYFLAALWWLAGLSQRGRLRSIHVLDFSDGVEPSAPSSVAVLTLRGVEVDSRTIEAASAFMQREGVEVLDLIPGNTPARIAMRLLRLFQPKQYRSTWFNRGVSAGYAVAATESLLARAGISPNQREFATPGDLIEVIDDLKRLACRSTDVAIAPTLRVKSSLNHGAACIDVAYLGEVAVALAWMLRTPFLILTLAGPFVSPVPGLLALVSYHCIPFIVFGGQTLLPRDLLLVSVLRIPFELWDLLQVTFLGLRGPDPKLIESKRPHYEGLLRDGFDALFQPRRETCPACRAKELKRLFRTSDLVQGKPGPLTLEKCRSCGHVFQNPQLNARGLQYYYSDFYEGLNRRHWLESCRLMVHLMQERLAMLDGQRVPHRWLEVGTGFGHFCCEAKTWFPETQIDGLDFGDQLEQARKAGWIDTAYRGEFPEMADQLSSQYDVVSMFHYLEHVQDQWADVRAAHTALSPGGFFLIEVPDPEYPLAEVLGRFWGNWVPPQHLNMAPMRVLCDMFENVGFKVIKTERGLHVFEVISLLTVVRNWLGPDPRMPWHRRASWFAHFRYWATTLLTLPLSGFALLLDRMYARLARRIGWTNIYRILARKPAVSD